MTAVETYEKKLQERELNYNYQMYKRFEEMWENSSEKAELDEAETAAREEVLESKESVSAETFTIGYYPAKIKKEWDGVLLENMSIKYPDIMECQVDKEKKAYTQIRMIKSE